MERYISGVFKEWKILAKKGIIVRFSRCIATSRDTKKVMTEYTTTKEELLNLLEQALKQNESKEVLERLQWFLHFAEHRSIS